MAAEVRRSIAAGLLAALLVVAGCDATATAPASASGTDAASASSQPSTGLRDVDVEPIEVQQADIRIAFSADEATDLVTDASGIDFGTDALLCVYLGLRPTEGWSLDLRTASLSDGTLSIAARENAPRVEGQGHETYPADCALIDRAALPPGELMVRADDMNTDEFIVDATVTVPGA